MCFAHIVFSISTARIHSNIDFISLIKINCHSYLLKRGTRADICSISDILMQDDMENEIVTQAAGIPNTKGLVLEKIYIYIDFVSITAQC